MAQQNINIGSSANKGDGDPIRTAFSKAQNNFTDLYTRLIVAEGQLGVSNQGGATIQQSIIGDVIGADSTVIVNHTTSTITAQNIIGNLKGSVVADDSTVIIDGVSGTIAYSVLSGKPTTIAGYGITDAQASLVSATNIKTINGASILGSGDLTVSGTSDDTLQDYKSNVNVTATDVFGNAGDGYTDIAITTSDTSAERFTLSGANGTAVDLPDCADAQFGKKVYIRTPGTGVSATIQVAYTPRAGGKTVQGFSQSGTATFVFTWFGSYWHPVQVT